MSSSDGSSNTDTDKLRTTFNHNFFDGTYQRNPRVRFGIVHVYNNYFTANSIYSIVTEQNRTEQYLQVIKLYPICAA
jgi:pectate lyase